MMKSEKHTDSIKVWEIFSFALLIPGYSVDHIYLLATNSAELLPLLQCYDHVIHECMYVCI